MKTKTIFMSMLFILGAFLLQAQTEEPGPEPEERNCASLENVIQECNRDGTVDITYQVSNNSRCDARGVTITTNGIGQSYPLNIPSQTVSATQLNYTGAISGTLLCFDIILHSGVGRECCRTRDCIRVEDPCESRPCASLENVKQECNRDGTVDITYQVSNNSLCDASGVTITTNGIGQSYPLNIPSQTVSATPITFSGAIPGTVVCFDIILFGRDGRECCRDRDCIRVKRDCCENGSDCDDFTFTRGISDNISTNLYQETFTSGVNATITVSLNAYRVPDRMIVTVNGVEVHNFQAGAYPLCSGTAQMIETRQFCVEECDIVELTVIGDSCPLAGSAWDLAVSCGLKGFAGGDINLNSRTGSGQRSEGFYEELKMSGLPLVDVFPNPATDVLSIVNVEHLIECQTARIINSSGAVIHIEDMSNADRVQVDVSSFPVGFYLIEFTDDEGHTFTEKFSKTE